MAAAEYEKVLSHHADRACAQRQPRQQNGVANINVTDSQIPLTGPNSIIGRAVVVHADPDDLGKDVVRFELKFRLLAQLFLVQIDLQMITIDFCIWMT
ncbi:superoxide dismutase9 isoform 1 [Panicum miliaceum]|uniref:Superoxide dismutase9 isoform 1 n=1 Tax=Panicum miliaceum TaxID=4540 RepID=A0A3L6PL80_PANMI|nr:superoxide dismutase9 isoform 1 [Panicum miliaceum]